MAKQITVCPVSDLPPGAVTGAGPYAVGNIDGKYFAVTLRLVRHRATSHECATEFRYYRDVEQGDRDPGRAAAA